jgi:Fe-S cluster assembly iron-binding protein IscA
MIEGIPVRVDSPAAMYAANSIVDYVNSLWGKGLTIRPTSGGC